MALSARVAPQGLLVFLAKGEGLGRLVKRDPPDLQAHREEQGFQAHPVYQGFRGREVFLGCLVCRV